MRHRFFLYILWGGGIACLFLAQMTPRPDPDPAYPADSLAGRIPPPDGFERLSAEPGSFAEYLRRLRLKPGNPPVFLFDGREKSRTDVHAAVVDLDIGDRNLQQCADAIIRLRAEYLKEQGAEERISFHFVSGFEASWARWRDGWRPRVEGNKVTEVQSAPPSTDQANFRRYLDRVFMYANSWSLARETASVGDLAEMGGGDLFIQSGFPGHAVIVADLAADTSGRRVFLLLQSFMPAQEIHVLKNPRDGTPWYPLDFGDTLITPEWTFRKTDLRRFRD